MSHDSWTHLLARRAIRPLLGTRVTPNHLTTLRLLSGVAACGLIATATGWGAWWGGAMWLVSAFLDRADGELARVGDMMSASGHRYDYYVDNLVNALFFVAAGFAVRDGWLGAWAIPLGVLGGVCMMLCGWWSELLEARSPAGTKAYNGVAGFDPDDALYLMGPMAWLGWLSPIVVGTALAVPVITGITGWRLRRLSARQVGAAGGGLTR
ncbi:MAG: CDP-alcohol phosphatidyltransferase family protein [Janthinobacterium lividum]